MVEQRSLQQARESHAILKRTAFDTGEESGCQPRTALEWLAWRDSQIWMLENLKEGIAGVMPVKHYGMEMPIWWRSGVVDSMALCFRRAEFMVWGEPQWQEVLKAAPAFEGSSMQVPAHCWMLWTWPGDRKTDQGAFDHYGLPPGFDLGAMAVYAMPTPNPVASETLRRKATGWGYVEEIGASGSDLVENFLNTDATIAFYFTVDDATVDPEYLQWLSGRRLAGLASWRDMLPILPRVVTLPHGRQQKVANGWEVVPAALGFLREKIFVGEKAECSRQQRRQYERTHPDRRSDIQIIQLRRTEGDAGVKGGSEGREYHSRWWVGGHWRRRAEVWQRGEGPIWVNAYVKGPDGAPLKSKSKRLVRVER